MKCIGGSACLVLALAMLSSSVLAADPAEDAPTLHVLRPIINVEKAKAEICLEFDHPIVAQSGTERASPSLSLKLESEDRKQTMSSRAATYSSNELCIPGLTHRTTYKLKLASFKSPSNGKLGSPYSLSFTVPARHPALTFIGDNSGSTVSRWHENPVLRSMNVGEAKLELFRIKDPARMAEAWSLRAQTALAPSETATFAHTHGEMVWQGSQTFDDKPDEGNEKQILLPDNVEPGLYLAVASAPNLITKKTELVPISAIWLLRSDLKIKLLQAENGFYALASDDKETHIPEKVVIATYNQDFKKVADATADSSGVAFMSSANANGKERKQEPLSGVMVATDERGHIGFIDLNGNLAKTATYSTPSSETDMLVTRGAYAPGTTAEVILAAQDSHRNSLVVANSRLLIMNKGGSIYASYPVKETTGGKTRVTFPVPVTEGIWPLVWKQNDGAELANGSLKVTTTANAPQLDMTSDRNSLGPDGEISLTIRSQTSSKSPSPMIQGKVRIQWKKAENIFAGWKDYAFGSSPYNEQQEGKFLTASGPTRKTMPFITDEKGSARISARIAPPEKTENNAASSSSLWIAIISIESEQGSSAYAPPPLELPLKPSRISIGIKALSAQARFPENGMARFDVIALDGDGNRVDDDNLVYRVYEEGRRFDWYQNTGKWDYKPIPQRTRVEGGSLSVDAQSRNGARLEIPVTSGLYKLEIADSEGQVLAQTSFGAGWGISDTTPANIIPLPVKLASSTLRPGMETKIQLKLEQPSLLRIIIADERIRKVFQETKPKGKAEVTFTPSAEWGKKLKITVEAEPPGPANTIYRGQIETGSTTKTSLFTKKELDEAASVILAAQSIKAGSQPMQTAYHQDFSGEEMALNSLDRMSLPAQMQWSPSEQAEERKATPQKNVTSSDRDAKHRKITKDEQGKNKDRTVVFIAPAPISNLPGILSYIVLRPAYTLTELTGSLHTLLRWKNALTESGLIGESMLQERIRSETSRILNRQAEDGGFSAMPGEEPDMVSTTAALSALSIQATPALAPAIAHAEEWLSHRLENAWYADRERPERAQAYEALARAGKTDMSNLRYFADTSANKELPPLACASIALAFAHNNDKNQAQFWIEKTKSAIAREKEVDAAVKEPETVRKNQQEGDNNLISPSTLTDTSTRPDIIAAWRALAENRFVNPELVLSEINKISEVMFTVASKKRSLDIFNDLAESFSAVLDRVEPWRVTIHGAEKRINKGIAIVQIPQMASESEVVKKQPIVFNSSNKQLAMEIAQWRKRSATRANMSRKILTLDGMPTHKELKINETYVVIDEGQWPENEANSLLVFDIPGPLLTPQTCALHPTPGSKFLGWLKDYNLTTEQHCERTPEGIYARLPMQQKETTDSSTKSSGSWRIAWLSTPRIRGKQVLTPPKIRAMLPNARTYEGPGEKINVQ